MPSLIVFRSLVKYDHLSLHLPLVVQPTELGTFGLPKL
jgi:hypothetical protein